MRSSSASATKFATSDEPPYETNGNVMPVSGITRDHAAEDDHGLQADDRRDAGREQLGERTVRVDCDAVGTADEQHEGDEHADRAESPSSSPIAENTKSVAAFGILSGLPSPRPVPANPPVPNAYHDWMIWKPVWVGSRHGSIHVSTRTCTCPNAAYATRRR